MTAISGKMNFAAGHAADDGQNEQAADIVDDGGGKDYLTGGVSQQSSRRQYLSCNTDTGGREGGAHEGRLREDGNPETSSLPNEAE